MLIAKSHREQAKTVPVRTKSQARNCGTCGKWNPFVPAKTRARLGGAFFSWAHAVNSFIFGVLSLPCGATPHERQRVWRKYLAPGRTNPPLAHCSRKTRDRAGK